MKIPIQQKTYDIKASSQAVIREQKQIQKKLDRAQKILLDIADCNRDADSLSSNQADLLEAMIFGIQDFFGEK